MGLHSMSVRFVVDMHSAGVVFVGWEAEKHGRRQLLKDYDWTMGMMVTSIDECESLMIPCFYHYSLAPKVLPNLLLRTRRYAITKMLIQNLFHPYRTPKKSHPAIVVHFLLSSSILHTLPLSENAPPRAPIREHKRPPRSSLAHLNNRLPTRR